MVDDPDAMWRPGYAAPEGSNTLAEPPGGRPGPALDAPVEPASGLPDRFHPAAGRRRAQRGASARPDRDPAPADAPVVVVGANGEVHADRASPRRTGRRPVALAVALAFVVAAALAVSLGGGDHEPRRPDPGEIRGADDRRVPPAVDTLWSAVLTGSGNALSTSLLVAGRDLVVAVVDDGSRNRTSIAGIDAATGEVRWRRGFSFAPPEVTLLGVLDDVLLVDQRDPSGRHLRGLSMTDGATLWDRQSPAGGVDTILLGTGVVTSVGGPVGDQLTFLDPATGRPVGDVVGQVVGTDLSGTWYVAHGDELVSIDLSAGWSDPALVPVRPPVGGDVAVVDGRLVAVADRRLVELTAATGSDRLDGSDALPATFGVFPAGGSSLVALTDGGLVGAELAGDRVRTTWSGDGTLRNFALTERGLVVVLGDTTAGFADGVELTVIDGITGDALSSTGVVGVDDEPPVIVGNGFVVTARTVDGVERAAYDLDGRELWRLPAAGKLRIGDELVVVMDDTPSGFRVTAYGPRR